MIFEHPELLPFAALSPLAATAAWRLRRVGAISGARALALGTATGGAVLLAALAAAGPRRGGNAAATTRGAVVVDGAASPGVARDLADSALENAHGAGVAARIVYGGEGAAALPAANPAAALTAAASVLDAITGDRRILLVSEGAEADGNLAAIAARLKGLGIPVDVMPLPPPAEVVIARMRAPAVVRAGEEVAVTARVALPARATARLLVDGHAADTEDAEPEATELRLVWRGRTAGTHALRLEVSAGEARATAESAVEVLPSPRALVVADGPSPAEAALSASGIPDRRIAPGTLPGPGELAGYDLVVLDGADPDALGAPGVAALSAWVRDGGSLVATAGAKGLAKGSSPAAVALRRLLPLATVDDEKKEPPPIALVFVLDRSDSMGRERKWEVVARTTADAERRLNEKSTVGLAVFSDFTDWIVPLSKVKDVPDFAARVGSIHVNGGTDMYPALREAFTALKELDVRKKHVVLLSDGVSLSTLHDNGDLIRLMAEAKITVSTVAVGTEADQESMKSIADQTGGRFYFVSNADDIPRIFTEETLRSSQDDGAPRPLAARVRKRIPALASIDPSAAAWPATTHARTRATSETLWQVDAPDVESLDAAAVARRPLLARGRAGRGTVLALAAPLAAAPVDPALLLGSLARAALGVGDPDEPRVIATPTGGGDVAVVPADGGALPDGFALEVDGRLAPLVVDARGAGIAPLPAARLARVRDASGRVVARIAEPALPPRHGDPAGTARLEALAAVTHGSVLAPASWPMWVFRSAEAPGDSLSLPFGLAALALAAACVWIRRPPTS